MSKKEKEKEAEEEEEEHLLAMFTWRSFTLLMFMNSARALTSQHTHLLNLIALPSLIEKAKTIRWSPLQLL